MGRIMAIDYGQKRTGIAVTDTLQIIATGLTTVPSATIFDFLKSYCLKEKVDRFVVGYPKTLSNEPAEAIRFVNPFLKKLSIQFPDTPIELADERFTSKMAFQTMIDGGLKKKDRQNKALIDTISATIILQSWMEQQNR
jgi:putative holliday junction resolvase